MTNDRNSESTELGHTLVDLGETTEPGPPRSHASDAQDAVTVVGDVRGREATAEGIGQASGRAAHDEPTTSEAATLARRNRRRTERGAGSGVPTLASDEDRASAAEAEALLKDLARVPLAPDGIAETSGQSAAAYAAAPRQPPRAGRDPTLRPSVLVNATMPLPAYVPVQLPTPDESRHAKTIPGILPISPEGLAVAELRREARARSEEARASARRRRNVLAGIFSIIGTATVVAVCLVWLLHGRSKPVDVAGAMSMTVEKTSEGPAPVAAPIASTSSAAAEIQAAAPASAEPAVPPEPKPLAASAAPPRPSPPRASPRPAAAASHPAAAAHPAPAIPSPPASILPPRQDIAPVQ